MPQVKAWWTVTPPVQEWEMNIMKKFTKFCKRLLQLLLLVAVLLAAVRFGPSLYAKLFTTGNIQWISERFSEELKDKNELLVFETTLIGKETVSQNAWLLGTVQKVQVPYEYVISFAVDLSQSNVQRSGNVIEVFIPLPQPIHSKLAVDDAQMKKTDWLYPLTPERYADIKTEIENKLYEECSANQDYVDAAWSSAEKNMKSLFLAVVEQANFDGADTITVSPLNAFVQQNAAPSPNPSTDPEPTV